MIQDIEPKKFHNEYIPDRKANSDSTICAFREGQLLVVKEGDIIRFPKAKELTRFGLDPEKCIYLFSVEDPADAVTDPADAKAGPTAEVLPDAGPSAEELLVAGPTSESYFLWQHHLSREIEEYGSYRYLPIRKLGHAFRDRRELALVTYTAKQLDGWYRDNRFCGTCGAETELAKDERAIVCTKCGRRIYPRILPAVIVGVTNGDQLLMTKYAGRDYTNYALVAGFTEIGESLEQTVAREVMEEAGLTVTNIRYYKSQPWGIVDDLLAGFYCDVTGDPTITMDPNELKEAVWMDRNQIESLPNNLSLTGEMMETFKAGKEPK